MKSEIIGLPLRLVWEGLRRLSFLTFKMASQWADHSDEED
jgi:hypothetical protein